MARALFILGHAGSGKTQLAKKWIKERIELFSDIDKFLKSIEKE